MRILVVEDDQLLNKTLSYNLSAVGYSVDGAMSKAVDQANCVDNDYSVVDAKVCQLYIKPKVNENNLLCDIEAVGRIALNYKIYSVEKDSFSIDSYIPHFKTVSQTEKITLKLNPIYYFDSKSFELSFENEKSVVEIVDLNAQIGLKDTDKKNTPKSDMIGAFEKLDNSNDISAVAKCTVDVTLEDGKSVASQQVYVVKIGNTWYVDNTNVDTSALYLAK